MDQVATTGSSFKFGILSYKQYLPILVSHNFSQVDSLVEKKRREDNIRTKTFFGMILSLYQCHTSSRHSLLESTLKQAHIIPVEPNPFSVCDVVSNEPFINLVLYGVKPGVNELTLPIAGSTFFPVKHPVGAVATCSISWEKVGDSWTGAEQSQSRVEVTHRSSASSTDGAATVTTATVYLPPRPPPQQSLLWLQ